MSKESNSYKNSPKKVYIRTFGCQMNEYDSGRVKDLLLGDGYSVSSKAQDADVLLFNTCSVRKSAEDRVFGAVSSLKGLKRMRPEVIFGIMGCMAEAQGESIFQKMNHVDFLCGPSDLDKIPEIIDKVRRGTRQIVYVGSCKSKRIPDFSKDRSIDTGYVKIMEGCDNFCSYCVVPYLRGRERSRPSEDILGEIRYLIDKGVKRITLLGQNVNSYGRGLKENVTFMALLRKIDRLASGRTEIDFMTSHPKDVGVDLFKTISQLSSLSKNLHLPIQSGSNKVLKRMKRGYTVEKYKKLIGDFRRIVKDGKVSSDFIVGFPGERKEDFNDTLKAVKEIQFDAAYIFKYSPRPFTKASKFKDSVSKEEKEERHALLLEIQRGISRKKRCQ